MFINGKTIRKSEYFAHDFVLNLWHMAILAKSISVRVFFSNLKSVYSILWVRSKDQKLKFASIQTDVKPNYIGQHENRQNEWNRKCLPENLCKAIII